MESTQPEARSKPPLTRGRILESALELIEREGASALSMRRLAAELDAGAMSLYHYVPSRNDLLDGLSETMVRQVEVEAESAQGEVDWRQALRSFAAGIRAVAHAHPQAFQLVGMRPLNTPEALPPIEAVLSALRLAGFDEEKAFYAYRATVAYARGYALAETGGFTFEPGGDGERRHLTPLDLDPEAFPNVAEVGAQLHAFDRDAAFTYGLDALIAGIAASAARSPSS